MISASLYGADGQYDDQLTTDDVMLAALPMCHQYGFITAITCLTLGHQVVVMSQFKPDQYVRLVDKYQVKTRPRSLFTRATRC